MIDGARLLDEGSRNSLIRELQTYPPGIQLQVWTVPSLDGESIEGLSIRAAEKWKLGDASTDRGALILVAAADRQMRIEVGQGLEGDIPDALAGRIVDRVMKPAFRNGRYAEGLFSAARLLRDLADKSPDAQAYASKISSSSRSRRARSMPPWGFVIILIFFIFLKFVSSAVPGLRTGMNSQRGWRRTGGWSGGGGFGSGGSGGSWGGGGGGFSGGGSSGSW